MSSTYAEPLELLARGLDDLAEIDPGTGRPASRRSCWSDCRGSSPGPKASGCGCSRSPTTSPSRPAPGPPRTGWPTPPATTPEPSAASPPWPRPWIERWTEVGAALADGAVNVPQARVIVEALDALPGGLGAETWSPRPRHTWSARPVGSDHRSFSGLGRGLLEVIAPEIADEAEYQRLVAEEKRASAATRLSFQRPRRRVHRHPRPDARPRRATGSRPTSTPTPRPRRTRSASVDQLPLARRRGEAFCALLENLPASGLPEARRHRDHRDGDPRLRRPSRRDVGFGFAETSTGDRCTAEQARRFACQADIVPVVLGGKGEILDLGRARRLFSPAQRKAMALRDRECTADGCDVPAAWCEAHHHRQPWSQGGRTDLADGKLLCPFHHHRAHDPGWDDPPPAERQPPPSTGGRESGGLPSTTVAAAHASARAISNGCVRGATSMRTRRSEPQPRRSRGRPRARAARQGMARCHRPGRPATHRPRRSTRSHGQSVASHPATASASGTSRCDSVGPHPRMHGDVPLLGLRRVDVDAADDVVVLRVQDGEREAGATARSRWRGLAGRRGSPPATCRPEVASCRRRTRAWSGCARCWTSRRRGRPRCAADPVARGGTGRRRARSAGRSRRERTRPRS